MADPSKGPSFADDDQGVTGQIQRMTLGEFWRSGKIVWAVLGGLAFLAALVVALGESRYEGKANARVTNDRQDAAIAKVANEAEVDRQVRQFIVNELLEQKKEQGRQGRVLDKLDAYLKADRKRSRE